MALFHTTVLDNQIKALDTIGTAQGSICTFDTDRAERLVNLEVAITATGGGGTPVSPIAINGFSACDLVATGKNLAKFTDGYAINVSGEIVSNPKRIATLIPIKFGNSAITISFTSSEPVTAGYAVYNNGVYVRRATGITSGTTLNITDGNAIYFQIYNPSESASTNPITTSNTDCQVELGSSPTTYEPFGTTETITFGQTVYGGRLNVGSGVLTVTHGILDLGSLYWQYNPSLNVFLYNLSDMPLNTALLCEQYEYTNVSRAEDIGNYQIWNKGYALSPHNILIKDTRYTDYTAFRTAVNGVQLVYELATPLTIQLDSKQIQAIIGTNNIYADCGDIIDLKFVLSVGQAIS